MIYVFSIYEKVHVDKIDNFKIWYSLKRWVIFQLFVIILNEIDDKNLTEIEFYLRFIILNNFHITTCLTLLKNWNNDFNIIDDQLYNLIILYLKIDLIY